jgi:hypothetical protein
MHPNLHLAGGVPDESSTPAGQSGIVSQVSIEAEHLLELGLERGSGDAAHVKSDGLVLGWVALVGAEVH